MIKQSFIAIASARQHLRRQRIDAAHRFERPCVDQRIQQHRTAGQRLSQGRCVAQYGAEQPRQRGLGLFM